MSFNHHGAFPPRDNSDGRQHQRDGIDSRQSELLKLFESQKNGTVKRAWPDGRIGPDDDGEIPFKIGSDGESQLIRIDFPKPVVFLAMSPEEAIQIAQLLIKHARAISNKPIRVILN